MTPRLFSSPTSISSAVAFAVLGSIVLLFAHLGRYPLWDDEAITAMTAKSVWRTGDTSARVDDHNLLVYRNGLLVRNFNDRYTPPLQFYVIAPFVGLLGDSSFICRLPSVLCGLFTVAILLLWLRRTQPPAILWWIAALLLLTNAEFFLFFRQCRYYGLAMLLTTLAAYLYCHRDRSLARTAALSITLAALLSAQYLDYAAVAACLSIDYLIWGRRQSFTPVQWAIIILPQILVGAFVCSIWNPLAHQAGVVPYHSPHILTDRLYLLWWNFRDMFACDFVIVPLLLVCPILYFKNRSPWLLRTPLALIVFISTIALAVPTSLAEAHSAEVRYLAPILPLCIAIEIVATAALLPLSSRWRWTLICISIASMLIDCTPLLFYRELILPQTESYTPVIDWVNRNVSPNQSIYVQPAYKTYPLMLRASKAIYAWQLTDPPRADFKDLPPIHFFGRLPPDYLIRFGTNSESSAMDTALNLLADRGIYYKPVATIHLHWKDWYRPERIWRSFVTVPPNPGEEIYIYQRNPS
jgi:hypothetical protein